MATITRRCAAQALLGLASGAVRATPRVDLEAGGSKLAVTFESEHFDLPQPALLGWVRRAALAVSTYYGRFPVPHARIRIFAEGAYGISHGTSFGEPSAWCRISVGRQTTSADLEEDWMLTHEMVHFAFPDLADRHHWMEEGLATYVEPVARVQAGSLAAPRIWRDMLRDMPQGLPEEGDRGLDRTHSWGRTYWGGALFCLMADVGIRRNTANAKGLQDALRAINRAGGSIQAAWPIERALEIGDRATSGHLLMEQYQQWRDAPVAVDLPDLWRQLGVHRESGAVVFDDHAPLAAVRRAITAP
jgi:hypothetical protein